MIVSQVSFAESMFSEASKTFRAVERVTLLRFLFGMHPY